MNVLDYLFSKFRYFRFLYRCWKRRETYEVIPNVVYKPTTEELRLDYKTYCLKHQAEECFELIIL